MSSCDLTVSTGLPGTTLTLMDHQGRRLAKSVGELTATSLEPGVYRVQVEAGADVSERLLVLRPGLTKEFVKLLLPLVTPVKAAARHHDEHAPVAAELSVVPTASLGRGSRLLIMVRVVDEVAQLPHVDVTGLDLVAAEPGVPPGAGLIDAEAWRFGPGYAACSIDVDPATYLLQSREGEQLANQPVQALPGWTTLLFLPAAPGVTGPDAAWTPQARSAVVHLAELDRGFEPYGLGSDEAFATEMALDGLRDGAVVLPDGGWDALLGSGLWLDPMGGLYAGHAALEAPGATPPQVEGLWERLNELLPGHADVTALGLALASARRRTLGSGWSIPAPVSMALPPMLRTGYAALLDADLYDPTVLMDGSPAELFAGRLFTDGVWSRWDPSAPSGTARLGAMDLDAAATSANRLVGWQTSRDDGDLHEGVEAGWDAPPPAPLAPVPPPAYSAPTAPPPSMAKGARGRILGSMGSLAIARLRRRNRKAGAHATPLDTAHGPPTPPLPPEPAAPPVSDRQVPREVARVAHALAQLEANWDRDTEVAPTVVDISRVVSLPVATVTTILKGLRSG
jgi:hypothetical protein